MIERVTDSAAATRMLGHKLGVRMRRGTIVLLFGDLGAGKTTFAKGIAEGMGGRDSVTSPTFTLIHEYETDSGKLIHMDPYRLATEEELLGIGFDELLESGTAMVIEWGERLGSLTPFERIEVRIDILEGERRRILLLAYGIENRTMLEQGDPW